MEPINKSLIANFSGKETSFFFKISPKVVFCTTVPEYGHNSICQKTDLTTFVSQVFTCFSNLVETEPIHGRRNYIDGAFFWFEFKQSRKLLHFLSLCGFVKYLSRVSTSLENELVFFGSDGKFSKE